MITSLITIVAAVWLLGWLMKTNIEEDVANRIHDPLIRSWIDALRSGKYAQGRGQLLDQRPSKGKNEYCCLGVLGELCGVDRDYLNSHDFLYDHHAVRNSKVPKALIIPPGTTLKNDTLPQRLACMNDGEKNYKPHTFKEIADYIERLPVDTFKAKK